MTAQERAAYFAAVREKEEELGAPPRGQPERPSDCVMLTSIDKPFQGLRGGVTMQVGKRSAAKLIVDGTHRLATKDEGKEYWADQEDRRKKGKEAEEVARVRRMLFPPAAPDPK